MAAAANKPGAVHYSLILFVMLSVILGITTYSFQKDSADKFAEVVKLTGDHEKANRAYQALDEQVQQLKVKIGGNSKESPLVDPANPKAGVIGGLEAELATNGKDVNGQNAFETLRKLREALDTAAADRDSKSGKILALEKEILAIKSQYQGQVDNYSKQSKDAERAKSDVIRDRDEKLNAKIQEISSLKNQLNSSRDENAQEKESREKETKTFNGTIASLKGRIEFQKNQIDNLQKLSFEDVDGSIRRVDHAARVVWIGLGEADFLKPRMTFSVGAKESPGVGRSVEDIKGKIEVTTIMGAHMAAARIIDEDLYRPMVSGDLIYTPIWTPGLIEKISLIGKIDMDNDGRSDREQLHQMMATAGAIIDNEVDDEGVRTPEGSKITVHTRFLVKGDIPELPDVPDADKPRVKAIQAHWTEMQNEARENGVRIIKLNDFLAFIGYHTKRRTFLAGQDRPFTLKAGAASESSKESSGDRTASGNVSKVYLKGRQKKQDSSDGANSKAFGGSGK